MIPMRQRDTKDYLIFLFFTQHSSTIVDKVIVHYPPDELSEICYNVRRLMFVVVIMFTLHI